MANNCYGDCGRYGALNSLYRAWQAPCAGGTNPPWGGCGCNGCNGCGGNGGQTNAGCGCGPAAAQYAVVQPVNAAAGGGLPLQFEAGDREAFRLRPNGVRINVPGRYMAFYTLTTPADTALTTTMALSLNGQALYASQQNVETVAATAANIETVGMALFEAECGDTLSLTTTAAITAAAVTAGTAPLATLMIVRIG